MNLFIPIFYNYARSIIYTKKKNIIHMIF